MLAVPLGLRGLGDAFATAAELDRAAKAEADDLSDERDAAEREELGIAMGAGGVGKGVAAAARRAKAAEKELEKRQKLRNTRNRRDVLDLALIDLAGFYRDALVAGAGAEVALTNPDRAADVQRAAREWRARVGAAQAGGRARLPRGARPQREAAGRARGDDGRAAPRLTNVWRD